MIVPPPLALAMASKAHSMALLRTEATILSSSEGSASPTWTSAYGILDASITIVMRIMGVRP